MREIELGNESKKSHSLRTVLITVISLLAVLALVFSGIIFYGVQYSMPQTETVALKTYQEYISASSDYNELILTIPNKDLISMFKEQMMNNERIEYSSIKDVVFDSESNTAYFRIKGSIVEYTAVSSFTLDFYQGHLRLNLGDLTYGNLWRIMKNGNEKFRSSIEEVSVNVLNRLGVRDLMTNYEPFISTTSYDTTEDSIVITFTIDYDKLSEDWYLNTYNPSDYIRQKLLNGDNAEDVMLANVMDQTTGATKDEIVDFTKLILAKGNDVELLEKLQLLLSPQSYEYFETFYSPFVSFNESAQTAPSYYDKYVEAMVVKPLLSGDNVVNYEYGQLMSTFEANNNITNTALNDDGTVSYTSSSGVIATGYEEGTVKSLMFEGGFVAGIITEKLDHWKYLEIVCGDTTEYGSDSKGSYYYRVRNYDGNNVEFRLYTSEETYEFIGIEVIIE